MNDFQSEQSEEPRSATRRRWARWAGGAAVAVLVVGGFLAVKAWSGNSSASATTGASTSTPAGASAGKVIPFQRGVPGASTVVGEIPASFRAGTGTIITGTSANKAKAAAEAAYPGGTVNRVVLLSDGDYNVHMIALNWPHHVFVDQNFKVVGAE